MVNIEGDDLFYCPENAFGNGFVEVYIVSGASWNLCGHALLHIHGFGYVHIAGARTRPKLMRSHQDFDNYLRHNHKKVLHRKIHRLPSPKNATMHLCQVMNEVWFHGLVINNCGTFVRNILHAVGLNVDDPTECPFLENRVIEEYYNLQEHNAQMRYF